MFLGPISFDLVRDQNLVTRTGSRARVVPTSVKGDTPATGWPSLAWLVWRYRDQSRNFPDSGPRIGRDGSIANWRSTRSKSRGCNWFPGGSETPRPDRNPRNASSFSSDGGA